MEAAVRAGRAAARRPPLREAALNELQQQILSGRWAVGDRLPTEPELGEELGVSRSVVRDVVRTLVSRGLIEVRHGFGTVVAEPRDDSATTALVLLLGRSDVTVGDVLDARAPIEAGLAAYAAKHGSAQDWRHMRSLLEELEEVAEDRDQSRPERVHRAWHLALLSACHLPALEVMLRPLQSITAVTSLPPSLRDPGQYWDVPSHAAIQQALEEEDGAAAQEAVLAHFTATESADYKKLRRTPFHAVQTLEAFDRVLG